MGGRINKTRQLELGYNRAHQLPKPLRLMKSAYLYDQSLYPLGCGDIGYEDPSRYADLLQPGELLVALASHQRDPCNATNAIDARFAARSFGLLIVPRCVYLPGQDGGLQSRGDTQYPTLSHITAEQIITSIKQQ